MDFSGCVRLSNNTGELSAIPQILAHFLLWRSRNPEARLRAVLAGDFASLEAEAPEDVAAL